MKKIYISILSLIISASAIAQLKSEALSIKDYAKSFDQNIPINVNSQAASSSQYVPFWESDFSDPTEWVIDNTGSITNEGWSIDPNVDSWYLPAFSSTGGGNFAEVGNGDPNSPGWNGPMGVEYTLTTALPINIFDSIGSGYATLSFEEYGARFNDLQAVQVSTDGTTFTTIGDNLNYTVTSQSAGSNPYPNPSLREINLAPYIGANPTSVWIRFSWTTDFPNQATNSNVWITYGWCIDNVKISQSPSNKLSMIDPVTGGYWIDYLNYAGAGANTIIGVDYSVTPLSQIAGHPFAIEALFVNEGTSTQSVQLQYEVTGSAMSSGSSNTSSVVANDSVFLGASFSPTSVGTYNVNIKGVADSAGVGTTLTESASETKKIEVSNYIYAKDLGTPSTSSRILGGPNDQWVYTTRYEMYANEQLYSVRVYIGTESVPGAQIKAHIYEVDTFSTSGGVTPIAESEIYTISGLDRGTWINIPVVDFLGNPRPLFNGYAYKIGVEGFQSSQDSSFIGVSGTSLYNGENNVFDVYGLNPNPGDPPGNPTWFYTIGTPMIRMNFDPTSIPQPSSIKDLGSDISIYPNPTSGIFTIELGTAKELDVKVYNVLSQVVYMAKTTSSTNKIDLSGFEKGIYTVELEGDYTTHQKKIIVE